MVVVEADAGVSKFTCGSDKVRYHESLGSCTSSHSAPESTFQGFMHAAERNVLPVRLRVAACAECDPVSALHKRKKKREVKAEY